MLYSNTNVLYGHRIWVLSWTVKGTYVESLSVELVRNKASGRDFIFLDEDTDGTNFLLITPEGKVRRLEQRLFGPLDIVDPKKHRCRRRLTKLQLKKYKKYFD